MNEEFEVKMSPLCQTLSRDDKTVHIEIYEDGDGGWLLEVVDERNTSTVWYEPFMSDKDALEEALQTIEKEGIASFSDPLINDLH